MADWYVSSASYASVAVWAATTAYTVGQFIKPTAPTQNQRWVYRCTTAGTSAGTEPNWNTAPDNNNTIVSGTATFTNVSGQSAYGWTAAAGYLYSLSYAARTCVITAGDRVFVSSDHSESLATISYLLLNNAVTGFGSIQVISVNRAGSVPPVAADIQSGAAITVTAGAFPFEAFVQNYYQGIIFTVAGGASQANFQFCNSSNKGYYFKNCAFVISNTAAGSRFIAFNVTQITFDNTTVQFGNVGQRIANGGYAIDLTWLNTPAAIQGATLPTVLFYSEGYATSSLLCRGVDLSAITGTLVLTGGSAGFNAFKTLLDSCRINSGVTRYGTSVNANTFEVVELVNCYDGTNVINERHTPAGDITADRSTYLSSGAQDDIGNYSLKLISSSRSDFAVMALDCFPFDVENTPIGSPRTATIEIVSLASLNNNDIRLQLEYMGTSGNPIASFADSLATILTPTAALPSSSATWSNPPTPVTTFNPADLFQATLSNNNLTATGAGAPASVRTINSLSSGKFYWEYTYTTINTNSFSTGIATAAFSLSGATSTAAAVVTRLSGGITINNSSTGSALGIINAGNVLGIAVDLTAQLIWFRIAPSGNWNGSGTANPATGTGGLSISALSGAMYGLFWTGSGDVGTANFGASAFTGSVPSGFTAGFPSGAAAAKQQLQVIFTPQRAGRVRGLVRLGKTSSTVWVNPQMIIT